MEKSDWPSLIEKAPKKLLSGLFWRVVEDQSEIATITLVDSVDEQIRLEELLEGTKPSYPKGVPKDYLLATPFRYPPLKWGSPFGSRQDVSIFYGSLSKDTSLAELAYYRFVFLEGVEGGLPNPVVRAGYDLFSAKFSFDPGVDLTQEPFADHKERLAHTSRYEAPQALGADLRKARIQGILYLSARCPKGGLNVAILEPAGLLSKRPLAVIKCYCEATKERVAVKMDRQALFEFKRELFLVKGKLPMPAPS